LAVLTLLGEARCTPLVGEEPGVAAAAAAAGGGEEAVAVAVQLSQHLTGVHVGHDRALGHDDLDRLAALAVQVLALAVGAVAGPAVGVVAERDQRGDVVVGDEPDVAAVAAVAAVRSAHDDGTFTTERDAASAAVTTADVELALVDELRSGVGHTSSLRRTPVLALDGDRGVDLALLPGDLGQLGQPQPLDQRV